MKQTILYLLISICCKSFSQTPEGIWQSKFYTIDSFQIDLSLYKNKPVVFVMISSVAPDMPELWILDSLNRRSNGKFVMIGILLRDSLPPLSNTVLLESFRLNSGISFPITSVSQVKKGVSKDERHLLLKWLVENPANNHFKIGFNSLNQVLIVNKRMALYAVLAGNQLPDQLHWEEIINMGLQN